MPTRKLTTTDGFVAIDLDDAPVSTGIVRSARSILTSGAADLARSLTYSYASLGMQRSGASAGVNATDDARPEAIAAFVAEIAPLVEAGTFLPDAGKGVKPEDLESLRATDPRAVVTEGERHRLIAAGAVAAAEHAVGSLDGRTVAIEGYDDNSRQLVGSLIDRGASVVAVSTAKGSLLAPSGISPVDLGKGRGAIGEGAEPAFKLLGASCDVIFTGSKMGAIDHTGAGHVTAKAVIPTAPIPVTAKALAVLRRAGAFVAPDFVVLAGPLLAAWPTDGDRPDIEALERLTAETVTGILQEVASHDDGPLLGACARAEAFLQSWRPSLPFGRPLAA